MGALVLYLSALTCNLLQSDLSDPHCDIIVANTTFLHMAEIHNANQIEQDEIDPEDGTKCMTRSVQRACTNVVVQQLSTILMYRRNLMTEPP